MEMERIWTHEDDEKENVSRVVNLRLCLDEGRK